MSLSPNCGPRRNGARPSLVVIHYTAMPDWTRARDWLCNPEAEVSAHYILSEAGEVVPLVAEEDRAWHAGAGRWGTVEDVNSHSIGIELSNPGNAPFAAPQMDALEDLLAGITGRWGIPPERVIGHSDCAPGRKIDPGPRFDWARLARGGLAVQGSADGPGDVDAAAFASNLSRIGYTADVPPETLLAAFRLRHNQGATGPLTARDCALAADLALRFPVDGTAGGA